MESNFVLKEILQRQDKITKQQIWLSSVWDMAFYQAIFSCKIEILESRDGYNPSLGFSRNIP